MIFKLRHPGLDPGSRFFLDTKIAGPGLMAGVTGAFVVIAA